MRPLVSVCMTTYNHEHYIAQAIESVLCQRTNFAVEVVVGEDCSTDNTLAICRRYEEQYPDRVRVVASESNIGMHANYRRTIEACRGQYIAMCDGDDYFTDPDKLQLQVDALQSNNAAMCYTRSSRCSDTDAVTYPAGRLHTTLNDMLILNTAENCTTLASREAVLQYYEQVKPHEHTDWLTDDLPMWLWFAATQKIVAIDRITAVHRVLATSVSHSEQWQKQLAFCYSLDSIMLWFDEHYNHSKLHATLSRRRQNRTLWLLSYHGSVGHYLKHWWRDCSADTLLLLNPAPYVLFAKKILWRMWRNSK
ncbi:MAG: glycosyltransferase [Alistipes sp.]|nr:glycosyltransferase [Alistipes sp.]